MALQIDMSGKTALVTGAGRGLGLAIAASFLEAGASVAVNDLQPEYVGKAVEELGRDDRVFSCPGDVGSVAGCRTVVGNAIEEFNGLDFLVNNAAVAPVTPVLELSEEQWDQTVNVALKGVFFCSQAALPALKRSKGAIVNVASEMGLRGGHDSAAYCAAKGGTVNLTRALALEAAPDVRVNCVCPGIMDTPLSVDTARILGVDYGEIGIEWAHRTQLGENGGSRRSSIDRRFVVLFRRVVHDGRGRAGGWRKPSRSGRPSGGWSKRRRFGRPHISLGYKPTVLKNRSCPIVGGNWFLA